jgi:hypothetical protein
MEVLITDRSQEALNHGLSNVHKLLDRHVRVPTLAAAASFSYAAGLCQDISNC